MKTSIDDSQAPESAAVADHKNVTCPFCGLLCDDLTVSAAGGQVKVRANGCTKAVSGFERALPAARPLHHDKEVALDDAVAAAAGMLRKARQPMIGGLATDVAGLRAALALADRAGAVVDHALSWAALGNIDVLQTTGWVMSTLTEVRNRADLLIVVASDIARFHPRFYERIAAPADSMFDTPAAKRTIVFIGEGFDVSDPALARVGEVVTIACANARAGDVIAALKAELRGAPLAASAVAGVPVADIRGLAERCRNAAYGVLAWVPAALAPATAGLTVQLLSDLVRDLNQVQRFAGLSLGGDEGAVSAASVCCWQSGYPLRVSYASGIPQHDPVRYSIPRMLASGEGDLLVWIASITPTLAPPPSPVPTIVLGTPGLALAEPPTLLIPVGTPGLTHAGRLIRNDSVVSLPLRAVTSVALPSVADVLGAITAAL